MRLSEAHKRVLLALGGRCALKSHRDVEGGKVYRLHPLDGHAEAVARSTVEYLQGHGLIDSNKKFPAATYWLTEKGKVVAETIRDRSQREEP
jgi:hypothetical protein